MRVRDLELSKFKLSDQNHIHGIHSITHRGAIRSHGPLIQFFKMNFPRMHAVYFHELTFPCSSKKSCLWCTLYLRNSAKFHPKMLEIAFPGLHISQFSRTTMALKTISKLGSDYAIGKSSLWTKRCYRFLTNEVFELKNLRK